MGEEVTESEMRWFARIWIGISFLFVVILLVLALTRCNGTAYEQPQSGGGGSPSLSYSVVISALIASKCLACHGPGPRDLSTYNAVMKYVVPGSPQSSKMCTTVATSKMPPGNPLAQSQIDQICEWIGNGAPV